MVVNLDPLGQTRPKPGLGARLWSASAIYAVFICCGCGGNEPVKPPSGPRPPVWVASWGDSGRAPGPFGFPTGVAVDPHGKVYVANNSYDRVEVISQNGVHLASWGRAGGGAGEFINPVSVSVGPDGTVAVGEITGRVQLFDSTGTYVSTLSYPPSLPPSHPPSHPPSSPMSYPPRANLTEAPAFVDIADTGLIFVCYEPQRLFARYSSSGAYESVWSSDSSAVRGTEYPCDVAVTAQGEVYLADWFGGEVRLATSEGHLVRTLDAFGTGGDQLAGPCGVDVDSHGRVYVTDRDAKRVSVFDADGHYLLSWGEAGSGPGQFGTDGAGGIAIGPGDLIYVTDMGNNRVQIFKWASPE